MKHFKYEAPSKLEEVSALLKNENAVLSAGGTDLIGVLKERLLPSYPDKVVSLKNIPGLDFIKEEADGLHIGAQATLNAVSASAVVRKNWQALADAAYSVASPNIRTRATIGGNICQDIRCWYYRYPHSIGGRINCARKEGQLCSAMMGENRYHSIFGAAKVSETPCTGECPGHTDISAYMELLRKGDLDGAARVIMEVNPMPAITSRVCAHFCMDGCNRNNYDESVNIAAVERYLGDYILEHATEYMKAPAQENGKKVAIVGSGPAGLTAAYYLRESGYAVTVYEKFAEIGGCLAYAIPAYRLPKHIVKKFVAELTRMGIVFSPNTDVGKDIALESIFNTHDSVILDTGTWKRPLIGLSGEEMTRFGLDFLYDINNYLREKIDENVVVVGGGNVAVDVAITAKRLGCPGVKMICLESAEEMPANQEEIDRALEEGVEIINGWGPKNILKTDGKIAGIEFKFCTRVFDDSGRFNPVYDENKVMKLETKLIFMAIGQIANLDFLQGACAVENERGRIKVSAGNATNVPGIFAGGDVTSGPATVIQAIAAGKATALSVNQYCRGEALPVERVSQARAKRDQLSFKTGCDLCRTGVKQELLPPAERAVEKEDLADITKEEAFSEAERCFNCGCLAVNPSDIANMLLAYDAVFKTTKRTIPAEDLLSKKTKITEVLHQGEVITEVIVPRPKGNSIAKYEKFRLRKSIDFAVLALASVYTVEAGVVQAARIVLGAAAPIPWRALKAEQYLVGKKLSPEVVEEVAEIALHDAIPLSRNAYKIDLAKKMIKHSLKL